MSFDRKKITLSSSKPLKVDGDVDVLVQLKMYADNNGIKVTEKTLIPNEILGFLPENIKKSILS